MRVPPYAHYPSWQRFFAGVVVGAVIGYVFFILIFGLAQEHQIDKIKEQQTKIEELTRNIKHLREGKDEENENLEKQLTVQEIKVTIESERHKIDRIIDYELRQKISEQLQSLVGQNIKNVADDRDLIFRLIEGHTFRVEDKNYRFKIKSLFGYSTINLTVELVDVENVFNRVENGF